MLACRKMGNNISVQSYSMHLHLYCNTSHAHTVEVHFILPIDISVDIPTRIIPGIEYDSRFRMFTSFR